MRILINKPLNCDVLMQVSAEFKNSVQKDIEQLNRLAVFNELFLNQDRLKLRIFEQKCSLEEEDCALLLNLLSNYFNVHVSYVCWDGGHIALYIEEKVAEK